MITRRSLLVLAVGLALTAIGSVLSAQSGPDAGDVQRLTGTYQLDRRASESRQQIANRLGRSIHADQPDRVSRDLMDRLAVPDTIAIDVHGRTVTLMSSNAARRTFDADGRDWIADGSDGQQMTTHAVIDGDQLIVSAAGVRGVTVTVTYEPMPSGMRVVRQVASPDLKTPVLVRSEYRRVADQPR